MTPIPLVILRSGSKVFSDTARASLPAYLTAKSRRNPGDGSVAGQGQHVDKATVEMPVVCAYYTCYWWMWQTRMPENRRETRLHRTLFFTLNVETVSPKGRYVCATSVGRKSIDQGHLTNINQSHAHCEAYSQPVLLVVRHS